MSDPDQTPPTDPTPTPTPDPPTYEEIFKRHPGASRVLAHGFAEWMGEEAKRNPDVRARRSMHDVFKGPLKVEFRVNGEEIPFFDTMAAVYEIHQHIVRDVAGEMFRAALEEKFTEGMRKTQQRLYDVLEASDREIRQLTRAAFPGVWLDGDRD